MWLLYNCYFIPTGTYVDCIILYVIASLYDGYYQYVYYVFVYYVNFGHLSQPNVARDLSHDL